MFFFCLLDNSKVCNKLKKKTVFPSNSTDFHTYEPLNKTLTQENHDDKINHNIQMVLKNTTGLLEISKPTKLNFASTKREASAIIM